MQTSTEEFFTRAHPISKIGKVIQFPLTRILIALVFLIPVLVLNKLFKELVYPLLNRNVIVVMQYIEAAVFFLLFMIVYRWFVRLIERRHALEVGVVHGFREIGTGFLMAASLVILVIGLLTVPGYYKILGWNAMPRIALDLFVKFFMGAFLEELLFRLILFKLTEEWLGSWAALIIQALLFGFSHLANENATVFTSFSIAIIGGLLYTAGFMYTRRIWLPLGLHLGWNYFQSGVFGLPNSGSAYDGLLIPQVTGPAWLTGGSFGIEASYAAILLCFVTGVVLLIKAQRSSQWVKPAWQR